MRPEEIRETRIWTLYEKGRNYHRRIGIYTDTDKNYRFYNGNQWGGAKLGDIEPVQLNFIKPIVRYKVAVVHANLFAIVYNSENLENEVIRKVAPRYCSMLSRYAARIWERDKMDFKLRRVTKDAAVNDEGIIYVDFDDKTMLPKNEIIKKNDIYFGNENDDNIQAQPYILIRRRVSVSEAIEYAKGKGVPEEMTELIVGDSDNFEESGEAAKIELDNMVTIVYKFYKKDGTVHFSAATRLCDICEDVDLEISRYPVAHFIWEEKEGSARGEGEVRSLIPNQIEVNRIEARRLLSGKYQAFPARVVDVSKVKNHEALRTAGATIEVDGTGVDDVRKMVGTLPPATMSPDVEKLYLDLMQKSRELAGAGEYATGAVNPEDASGKAILAVQRASEAPMTEQKDSCKNFVEDLGMIYLEYLIAHSGDGVNLEEEVKGASPGKDTVQYVKVSQKLLRELRASVKIDITPKSDYDKFAQEQTIENLLVKGFFSSAKRPELKAYVSVLDDDSVAPKLKLEKIIEYMENEDKKIAQTSVRANMLQQQGMALLGRAAQTGAQMGQMQGMRPAVPMGQLNN